MMFWRIAVYAFCARMSCRIGTVAASAAHQVATNLWWAASAVSAEPMESSVFTFLPEQIARQEKARRISTEAHSTDTGNSAVDGRRVRITSHDAKRTLVNHLGVAFGWGSVCAVLASLVAGPSLLLLTKDPAVLGMVPIVPVVFCCIVAPAMLVLEGTLVSIGRFQWGVNVAVGSALASVSAMLAIERANAGGLSATSKLHGYWWCVVGFQSARLAGNAIGVWTEVGEKRPRKLKEQAGGLMMGGD